LAVLVAEDANSKLAGGPFVSTFVRFGVELNCAGEPLHLAGVEGCRVLQSAAAGRELPSISADMKALS
jgi:hypothetical protein